MKMPGWNSSSAIVGSNRKTHRKNIPFTPSPGGSWGAIGTTTALEAESDHEPNAQNTGRSPRAATACAVVPSDAFSHAGAGTDDAFTRYQTTGIRPTRANCRGADDTSPRIATATEWSNV